MSLEGVKIDDIVDGKIEGREKIRGIPDANDAYINNPGFEKEFLTKIEALNIINHLSGVLLIDGRIRDNPKNRTDIQT